MEDTALLRPTMSDLEKTKPPRPGAQAIRRALTIIRIVAGGRDAGVALQEIVHATALSRPTVHRIVAALVDEGILERKVRTGSYAVGGQIPELALARRTKSPLLLVSEQHLDRLSVDLGDTLFLTIRTGLDTLCLARRIGSYPVQVLSIEVGARRPLGVSSAGTAILAALPRSEAARIIRSNELRYDSYGQTTTNALREVSEARRRRYNLRPSGLVPGTRSISAWIKTRDITAALTLSAIRNRLGPRREHEVAETLANAARSIEKSLAAKK